MIQTDAACLNTEPNVIDNMRVQLESTEAELEIAQSRLAVKDADRLFMAQSFSEEENIELKAKFEQTERRCGQRRDRDFEKCVRSIGD